MLLPLWRLSREKMRIKKFFSVLSSYYGLTEEEIKIVEQNS